MPVLNLLDAAPFGLAPSPLGRMISNGTGFYAVWNEQLPDFSMAVKGAASDRTDRSSTADGVNISGPNEPGGYSTTSVAWDGSQWKVTWGSLTETRLARVNAAGQVLDPGGVLVAGAKTGISASAGNGSVQLAWSDFVSWVRPAATRCSRLTSTRATSPDRTGRSPSARLRSFGPTSRRAAAAT